MLLHIHAKTSATFTIIKERKIIAISAKHNHAVYIYLMYTNNLYPIFWYSSAEENSLVLHKNNTLIRIHAVPVTALQLEGLSMDCFTNKCCDSPAGISYH